MAAPQTWEAPRFRLGIWDLGSGIWDLRFLASPTPSPCGRRPAGEPLASRRLRELHASRYTASFPRRLPRVARPWRSIPGAAGRREAPRRAPMLRDPTTPLEMAGPPRPSTPLGAP